jgi:proliferating cell nuclear antigen
MSDDAVVSGLIGADKLQQYIDIFGALVDECKWHFGDEGITGAAVDPANVAMLDGVRLSASAFDAYDAPGQVTLGLDLERLDDLINSATADDLIDFYIDMETRKLVLSYREITHEMGLIDPDMIRNDPDLPDLDLPNHVIVDSDRLDEAITNVALMSDHITIEAADDPGLGTCFVVSAEGDTDRTDVTFPVSDLPRAEIDDAEATSLFSIAYLEDLIDPVPSQVDVTIHAGTEFPMKWEYDLFDEQLDVTAMLAPRIQSD